MFSVENYISLIKSNLEIKSDLLVGKGQIVEQHSHCVMLKSGKYCEEMHLK